MTLRNETRVIKIKDKYLGGANPILVQSMCNTKTHDVASTIDQILKLEEYGCDIIRVAVLDMEDAKSISKIKKGIHIPLVADIHFDPELAIEAIKQGVDAIRLNPGNISNKEKIIEIVNLCKEHKIPIRIGVNGGSLPKGMELNSDNMIKAAKMHVDILEELGFYDIVISIKASNIKLAKEAYIKASKTFNYPLHVGITEAGTGFKGLITSSMGLQEILKEGIGNTIRVSLTDDPINEVKAARVILNELGLKDMPIITSCPTCGRTQIDLIPIAKEIEDYLYKVNKKIHVAVMGCVVNGPGEAREADLGVAGGKGEGLIFSHGKVIKKIKEKDIVAELKAAIDSYEV